MLAFYAQRALVGTGCIRVFLFRPSMHLLAFLTPLLLLLLLLLLPLSRICAPPRTVSLFLLISSIAICLHYPEFFDGVANVGLYAQIALESLFALPPCRTSSFLLMSTRAIRLHYPRIFLRSGGHRL